MYPAARANMNAEGAPSGGGMPATQYRALQQRHYAVQQQKERLLHRQQQQQLLVPESARTDQLCKFDCDIFLYP